MEMLGHLLFYFLRGSLPWQNVEGRSRIEVYRAIYRKKTEISPDDLCVDHPQEFSQYLSYCRGLKFTEEPDYDWCLDLFTQCMKRHKFSLDNRDFIWNRRSPK